MSKFGKKIIKGLKNFLDDFKNKKPITVFEVTKEETSEGVRYTRKRKYLNAGLDNEHPHGENKTREI